MGGPTGRRQRGPLARAASGSPKSSDQQSSDKPELATASPVGDATADPPLHKSGRVIDTGLNGLSRALRTQDPIGVALCLRTLAMADETHWYQLTDLADQLVSTMTLWCAEVFEDGTPDPLSRLPEALSSRARFRIACLLIADAVAEEFKPDMRAQILDNLASVSELGPESRVVAGRQAIALAQRHGREIQALQATGTLLRALHDADDALGVAEATNELCDQFLDAIAKEASGVGLYELLKTGSESMTALAEWLAQNGYAREAFLVVQVAGGWLCQAMAREPDLVDDYEAVQRVRHDKKNSGFHEALYERMEERMLQRTARPVIERAALPSDHPADQPSCDSSRPSRCGH